MKTKRKYIFPVAFIGILFFINTSFGQIYRPVKINFSQKNNLIISNKIILNKVENNPFISLSLILEGEYIDSSLKQIQYWDGKKWNHLKKDPVFSGPNRLVGNVYLNNETEAVQISVSLKNSVKNLRGRVDLYYPMNSDFLKKKNQTTKLSQKDTENPNLSCSCPRPNTISRSTWCPNNNCPPDATPVPTNVKFLIVHHTATSNNQSDWAAVVRAIWNYHVNSNGWDDIGYNFLVDPNGNIYDGRPDDTKGAHFSGHNSETSGISFLGTYTTTAPSSASIGAFENLAAWKACQKNIDVLAIKYHSSSGLNLHTISGHRDGGNTTCPGDMLYNQLENIRTAISNYSCYTLGINLQNIQDIKVYPNPSNTIFYIKAKKDIEKIILYDFSGKILDVFRENKINLQKYSKGLYLIKVFDIDNNSAVLKIIKK